MDQECRIQSDDGIIQTSGIGTEAENGGSNKMNHSTLQYLLATWLFKKTGCLLQTLSIVQKQI